VKIKRVVVNASPLIILFKSQLAHLLPDLFEEILVPIAVWNEVTSERTTDIAAQELPSASWAKRVEVEVSPVITVWNLGQGESEVLSLALERPDHHAMVDDAAARRCARALNISILGTGGALVLAKRRGLIPSVATCLQILRDTGLWLSDEVVTLLMHQAGE
jgi:predicted nucleic acid-binding protein